MTVEQAIAFLEAAARYFERRDTHGEDRAFWSNVYNAQNCRKIIELLKDMTDDRPGIHPRTDDAARVESADAAQSKR